MYRFALLVVAVTLLSGSIAQAASYKKTDGTVVDPIMDTGGSPHSYSGNNLESGANLTYANLSGTILILADLTYAYLINANLINANLINANLSDANLSDANLSDANLSDAYLSDANLSDAYLSDAYLSDAYLSDAYLDDAYLDDAYLDDAYLDDAYLDDAYLDDATFSPGTTLKDGQTVAQHGFDAASLQTYLEASPISASSASNLTIVPEPASVLLLLTGLLTLGRIRF